jgi:hypothetical protein
LDKLPKKSRNISVQRTVQIFPKEHLDFITKKLAYPYEYIDSPEKFQEKQLPPIEKFYRSLNKENVGEE